MWADMALKQGEHFNISAAVLEKRDDRERNARALWDTLMKYKSQGQGGQAEVHNFALGNVWGLAVVAFVFGQASYGKGGAAQPQGGMVPPKRPFEGGAQTSGPPGKKRKGGDGRKKCFKCNGFGHFIADCPLLKERGSR
jgi:hypothetical protein